MIRLLKERVMQLELWDKFGFSAETLFVLNRLLHHGTFRGDS